ncbi:hypothetical protein BTR14_03235 [Rhizobium rhizosphaerae]|uniref:Uncharacterized protein n=2 Tax=Xaviernesmea rhizosphaerae TaxID=1672749 RepID=A0ABX3PGF2_9HYPH|nr:hypothetical protein BTR14_03235 [Xaviernesmea rhizosphaerae]
MTPLPQSVEIEGFGVFRLPNVYQMQRIRRMKRESRHVAGLAFGMGMTVHQFCRLPVEARREIDKAFARCMGRA